MRFGFEASFVGFELALVFGWGFQFDYVFGSQISLWLWLCDSLSLFVMVLELCATVPLCLVLTS